MSGTRWMVMGLWAAMGLAACSSAEDEPIDGFGGSSEDGADDDADYADDEDGGESDGDGSESDGDEPNLDPLIQRCAQLFITEDEIGDCVRFAESSVGDPMGLVEACAAFDSEFRRWECLNAGATAAWPPESMIEACVGGGADLSRSRSCVLTCADVPEDPTPDFAVCNGSTWCMIKQCW